MFAKTNQLTTTPNKTHLSQLKKWLKLEYKQSGEGFLCNWNVIENCWRDRTLYCSVINGEAAALCAWHQVDFLAVLDIVTVNPALRQKGVGRRLVKETLSELKRKGAVVVEVECQPRSSEPFWRRVGFNDDDLDGIEDQSESLFEKIELSKKIVDTLRPSVAHDKQDAILQLWSSPPWDAKNVNVWRQWNLGESIGGYWKLKKPILHACEGSWRARLSIQGKKMFDGEIRYLQKVQRVVNCGYLYVHMICKDDISEYG